MIEMVKEDQVYTPSEVAKALRVSPVTVSRSIRDGRLHAFRVGGQWRVLGAEVVRFIENGTKEAMTKAQTSEPLAQTSGHGALTDIDSSTTVLAKDKKASRIA